MADVILQASGPLSALLHDSALSLALEVEDLTLMSAERIEEVIAGVPPGEMRGFFLGVLHMRNMLDSCMGSSV